MRSDKNTLLKIRKLTLKNFRCFEERTFEFDDEFNVLIGDNGSGKTAVLDALAVAVSGLLYPMAGEWGRQLEEDDVRRLPRATEALPRLDPQWPTEAESAGVVAGVETSWTHRRVAPELRGRWETGHGLRGTVLDIAVQMRDAPLWPLVGYYDAARFRSAEGRAEGLVGAQPRAYGYKDCLNPAVDDACFVRWFKNMELVRWQEGGPPRPALAAVRGAIRACVEECEDVAYAAEDDEVRVALTRRRSLPFRMLSGGQRAMLAMVADMVWRASALNPQLGEATAAETPGIVLIDEIDLHLHPSWQQTIVDGLRRTFPRVQFIATTHSPFIIQSLRGTDGLVNLAPLPPAEYAGEPLEDIVEQVQGIPVPEAIRGTRYRDMIQAAKDYFAYLEEAPEADPARIEQLKARLDETLAPYRDDPAYEAFLEMKRAAAGLGDDDS